MSHPEDVRQRLQAIEARLSRLRAERDRFLARASLAERKRDTRRKIVLGGTVLAAIEHDGVPALKDWAELVSAGTIPAYANMFLVLAAANRDPRQFRDPQIFDIARANNRHLGFGFGTHHCVGAPLSRIEGEVVFEAMARRFSRISLVQDPPPYKDNVSLPGVAALEVELAP